MRAIDVHCHLSVHDMMRVSIGPFNEEMEKYYKMKMPDKTIEEMANDFTAVDIKCMPTGWDAETNTGMPKFSNDKLAEYVKKFPDAFIGGWACVDPLKGEEAIKEAKHAIKDLGLNGLKFQQGVRGFAPNEKRFYPLWETCVELGCPVQFHTGSTGMGAGIAGGMGVHIKYYDPLMIDDVAADFPTLKIIALHPAYPWQEVMIAVLRHKGNVYNELSGYLPRRFPKELIKAIPELQDKIMMGSDYPAIIPAKWLDQFEKLGFGPEINEKVFIKNAQRILNLGD
jgi:predicted TIM-barrel fold metal-dependent hydrolase